MRVAIIGAGPSGLTTLKYLVTANQYFNGLEPITVRLFERHRDIGGTFRFRTYRDSELVSSKYLTAFSDYRFPLDSPDFATPEAYVSYLWAYVRHYGLEKYIHLSSTVDNVRKAPEGGHIVTISALLHEEIVSPDGQESFTSIVGMYDEEWHCDAVVVCSGLNVTPNLPDIPGFDADQLDEAGIQSIHSREYKGDEFFDNARTVAILGAGETAMDVAYHAVNHPDVEKIVMCNRDGFLIAPKITPEPVILGTWGKPYPGKRPNKPLDTTIASLFDTMYVPGILQRGPLLWLYYDRWIKYIFFLIAGTSQGIDQWVGGVSPRRRYADALFLVKSDKAVPYMSSRHRKGFWNAIRSFFINVPIEDTGDRVIEVKAWPTHVDQDGTLNIPDQGSDTAYRVKPDRIILATGYRTEFPFLQEGQYPTLAEARVRGIYRYIEEGFAYIGFVRPSIGAIPPLAELQAQLWVYRFLQHHHGNQLVRRNTPANGATDPLLNQQPKESVIAPYELDYALHARGTYDFFNSKRGVDHESYAFQLALDLGAAPTFMHMLTKTNWRCIYTWAMGPNFNTKFRLVGPWARPRLAKHIMQTELYGVVKRTGGLFFFVTYTAVPFIIFGILSMAIKLVQQIAKGLVGLFTARQERYPGARAEEELAQQGGMSPINVVRYF